MSNVPDITGDFAQIVDGLETVVHVRRDQTEGQELPGVLRRAVTLREAEASGGRYTAADVTWHIPADALVDSPAPGDTLTDAEGAVWTVLTVRRETLGNRWACVSRQLQVAAGLDERIRIQIATWTKGAAGALTATWTDVLANLPARIQPQEGHVTLEHGQRLIRVTHRVFVAAEVSVDDRHRIVASDGRVYHVVAYERPQRIDLLPVIHTVVAPWPLA